MADLYCTEHSSVGESSETTEVLGLAFGTEDMRHVSTTAANILAVLL
jgi:hypothetical protein